MQIDREFEARQVMAPLPASARAAIGRLRVRLVCESEKGGCGEELLALELREIRRAQATSKSRFAMALRDHCERTGCPAEAGILHTPQDDAPKA